MPAEESGLISWLISEASFEAQCPCHSRASGVAFSQRSFQRHSAIVGFGKLNLASLLRPLGLLLAVGWPFFLPVGRIPKEQQSLKKAQATVLMR
jgi:hypothetical protein